MENVSGKAKRSKATPNQPANHKRKFTLQPFKHYPFTLTSIHSLKWLAGGKLLSGLKRTKRAQSLSHPKTPQQTQNKTFSIPSSPFLRYHVDKPSSVNLAFRLLLSVYMKKLIYEKELSVKKGVYE